MKTFGHRLAAALAHRGPVCVGIDPHAELLRQWGLGVDADGVEAFAEICVEAFDGIAALVKPQVAFFEPFGAPGMAVLERTISVLRSSGTLVLADAKRGDIGSTMAAYAQAWLDDASPLCADAVTVNPFLGFGALDPVLELVHAQRRGVFVLAATSNPEAAEIQQARLSDGRTISQSIVDAAAAANRAAAANATEGERSRGSVGVVVGATLTDGPDLSGLDGPVLLPGVGAQGGGPDQVRRLVGDRGALAVPAVSREVLQAGPSVSALRERFARIQEQFAFLQV